MGKYSKDADNPSKSCKARSSNLRVHFKVSLYFSFSNSSESCSFDQIKNIYIIFSNLCRTQEKQQMLSRECPYVVHKDI
jgi:hypothetical protein